MPACVDFGFDGAVKPCLGNRVTVADCPSGYQPECVQGCPWEACCDLAWRDPGLGEATALKVGRMVTGGVVGQEAGGGGLWTH